MKTSSIKEILSVIFCVAFAFSVIAQVNPGKPLDENSYRSLSQLETVKMVNLYGLNTSQKNKITAINDDFYLNLVVILRNEKIFSRKQEKIAPLQSERQKKLRAVFTADQYNRYRNDMSALEAKDKKRMEEFRRRHFSK